MGIGNEPKATKFQEVSVYGKFYMNPNDSVWFQRIPLDVARGHNTVNQYGDKSFTYPVATVYVK